MIPTSKLNPTCQSCPSFSTGGSRLIRPLGTGAIPLLILTDQPSECEEINSIEEGGWSSLSKQSPGGYTFAKACDKLGIGRDQMWAWSMFKCTQPSSKNNPLEIISLTQCQNHLTSFIDFYQPQAILALGDVPIRWLTGHQGKKQGHMNLRGYILDNQRFPSIPVVAGIDPAHIVNVGKPILRRALAYDLHKAITLAKNKGQFTRPNEDRYELFPPLDRLREMYTYLKEHPDSPIYYDIETHESFLAEEQDLRAGRYGEVYKVSSREQELDPSMSSGDELPWDDNEAPDQAELLTSRSIITQIQFACDVPDWAIAVVWSSEAAAITRDIFALPNLRVNVNCVPVDGNFWGQTQILPFNNLGCGEALFEEHLQFKTSSRAQATSKLELVSGLAFEATKNHKLTVVEFPKGKYIRPSTAKKVIRRIGELDTVNYNYLIRQPLGKGGVGIDTVLDLDLWKVFGLLYTDGTWSPPHKTFHFSNCDVDVITFIKDTLTRHGIRFTNRIVKMSEKKSTWRDVYYMTIWPTGLEWARDLAWPNWKTSHKKHIQIHEMSKASQSQLLNFIAGCIDGDGTITDQELRVCAYNSDTKEMAELYQWAGLLIRRSKNMLVVWRMEENVKLLKQIKLHISYKQKTLDSYNTGACRQQSSPSKRINKLKIDGEYWIALRDVTEGRVVECVDLMTTSEHFTYNGVWIHNCRVFDDPILRAAGVPLNDHRLDLMDLFHRYEPDLPKSLGFITPFFWPNVKPWKHLSQSEPGVYGCRDVIALQKIHHPLVAACEKDRIWTSFQVHDMQLGPALDRIQARGYPCDATRKDHFGAVLQRYVRILKSRMAGLYPQDLLSFDKNSGPYEEKPTKLKKDFGEENLCEALVEIEETHKIAELRTRKGKIPPPEVVELAGQYIDRIPSDLMKWFKVKETKTGRQLKAMRWVYRKNFNPQSRDQVLAYLEAKCEEEWQSYVEKDLSFQAQYPGLTLKAAEALNKPVAPRGWRTNHAWFIPPNPKEKTFKPWIASRGLKRLMRSLKAVNIEDPLLPLLIKTTAHAKMYSSFVQTWKPSTENLVHTTFKFSPATPQLAAVNPNILAAPAHGALAKRWKWTQRAHEGKRFINFDYGGFHCITTGFLAKDPSYIYAARIDIHGILGYISEKLPNWERLVRGLTDQSAMGRDELAKLVKDARTSAPLSLGMTFKERRDEIYKRVILGVQLGMGAYTMYMNAPEAFGSRQYSQSIIDQEKKIWPKIFQFQDTERANASLPPNLSLDAYGYLRRFEEVNRSEWSTKLGRWETKPGPDSEKAIAAKVQGIAFGFIRDGLIWLDKARCPETGLRWADKFGLANSIHDSFVFHCPEEYTEECLTVVGRLLQRRSSILVNEVVPDGLWCKVEASIGVVNQGYDTCKEVQIPLGPFDMPIEKEVGWIV